MKNKIIRGLTVAVLTALLMTVFLPLGAICIEIGDAAMATKPDEYLTVEEMFDLNKLYQNHSGWKFQHASSYDMNEGNLDGQFFDKQENIQYTTTLLEAKGPGVVTRFWSAGYAEDEARKVIHIYVDGELLLEGKAQDFFNGCFAPFVKPYVGIGAESGGGTYCYVPIVFQESIRITAEYANYWNIDYTIFPSDTKVHSTTITAEPVIPSWYRAMSHNIDDMTKGAVSHNTATISAGDTVVLYQDSNAGVIEGLNLFFDGLLDANAKMEPFATTGRWIKQGGNITFNAKLNPSNQGAFVKWRVDSIWANQIIDLYVDGTYVGRSDSGMAGSAYRYKDMYMEVPSALVAGKNSVNIKMVAVSSGGLDIPLLDVWVYSKLEGGTILSTYLDVYNGLSETEYNFSIQDSNGGGSLNAGLTSDAFRIDLNDYTVPAGSTSIRGVREVAIFTEPVEFILHVSGDRNLILRRTTNVAAEQTCTVWVNDKKIGTWNVVATEVDALGETYFTIPASVLTSTEVKVSLVPSRENYIGELDVFESRDGVYSLADSIDFCSDKEHQVTGDLRYLEMRYAGVTTFSTEWTAIMDTLTKAIDSAKLLDELSLRVWYGDDREPSIDMPLNALLGIGEFGFYLTRSITQGISDDGTCYFYLPIPYKEGIRVALVSTGSFLEIDHFDYAIARNELSSKELDQLQFLKTKTTYYAQTEKGIPLSWLETSGSGKLVGLELSIKGHSSSFEYLEGDEIICVDGNKSHVAYGTGTEDIINSAWYFVDGAFSQAFHGAPFTGYDENGKAHNSMYAWYIFNQVNFRDGIYATVEHGPQNLSFGDETTISAFYYHNERSQIEQCGIFDYRDGETDCIDEREYEGRLEGNYSNEYVVSDGRRLQGAVSYTVQIPKNNQGLLLRRLFSLDNVLQAATVYVDGQEVGIWHNNYNRPADRIMRYDDYIIPAEYTAGKSSVILTFSTLNGYVFDETTYSIFAMGYGVMDEIDTDSDGLPDKDDPMTAVLGEEICWYCSYQSAAGIRVQKTPGSATDERIADVLKTIGNGFLLYSFDLTITSASGAYTFDYDILVELIGIQFENCVVIKLSDNTDTFNIISCISNDTLRFNTNSGGRYLILGVE